MGKELSCLSTDENTDRYHWLAGARAWASTLRACAHTLLLAVASKVQIGSLWYVLYHCLCVGVLLNSGL